MNSSPLRLLSSQTHSGPFHRVVELPSADQRSLSSVTGVFGARTCVRTRTGTVKAEPDLHHVIDDLSGRV